MGCSPMYASASPRSVLVVEFNQSAHKPVMASDPQPMILKCVVSSEQESAQTFLWICVEVIVCRM